MGTDRTEIGSVAPVQLFGFVWEWEVFLLFPVVGWTVDDSWMSDDVVVDEGLVDVVDVWGNGVWFGSVRELCVVHINRSKNHLGAKWQEVAFLEKTLQYSSFWSIYNNRSFWQGKYFWKSNRESFSPGTVHLRNVFQKGDSKSLVSYECGCASPFSFTRWWIWKIIFPIHKNFFQSTFSLFHLMFEYETLDISL